MKLRKLEKVDRRSSSESRIIQKALRFFIDFMRGGKLSLLIFPRLAALVLSMFSSLAFSLTLRIKLFILMELKSEFWVSSLEILHFSPRNIFLIFLRRKKSFALAKFLILVQFNEVTENGY